MENRESADVSIPSIRTAVRLRRCILLFRGQVNSQLRQTTRRDGVIFSPSDPVDHRFETRQGERVSRLHFLEIFLRLYKIIT
jgi:hypothetical protein